MNIQRFSKREIQQMLLKLIKKYPGVGLEQLSRKTGICVRVIFKYVKDMEEIIIIDHLNEMMFFPKEKKENGKQ